MDTTYLLGHGESESGDRGNVSREVAEVYSLVVIRVEAEVIVLGNSILFFGNLLKALVAIIPRRLLSKILFGHEGGRSVVANSSEVAWRSPGHVDIGP